MIYTVGFNRKGMTPCSVEDVVRFCKKQKLLGLDTETTGLDSHTSKIIMFQIGTEEHQFIIDMRKVS